MLTLAPEVMRNEPNMHVFGWWEESGVPEENPCLHGENMQTPHRKAHRLRFKPSCSEGTVLTTTALYGYAQLLA